MNEPMQYGIAGSGEGRHPDADQIAAFLERALPAHERETMLAHLAVCPECRTTVALSLPPEETAAPLTTARSRPWFAGWGLAWPAGAALALALAVYVRREAVLPQARPAPVEVARAPEPPAIAGDSAPAAGRTDKTRDEKEKASPLPRAAETVNQPVIADRKLDRARDAEEPAEAAAQKPFDMLAG